MSKITHKFVNSTVLALTQPKHNIGVSNITHTDLTPEIKKSIGVLIELFKKSIEIDDFAHQITDSDIQAVLNLEGLF